MDLDTRAVLDQALDRLLAGGWVAGALVGLVLLLSWMLRRRGRALRALRRELHGSRVRDGYVAEALAPLAEDFPVEVGKPGTTTTFLGQPIDYVHFDPDEGITFVEIKSGAAGLSRSQRELRARVEEGSVRWSTLRLGGGDPLNRDRRE